MSTSDGGPARPEPGRVSGVVENGADLADARRSVAFSGAVGVAVAAADVSPRDYLIDIDRYPSEGNWAFCRFENEEIPAIRLGFELGGFNPGPDEATPNRRYLQLHLEVMTSDGALFWLP